MTTFLHLLRREVVEHRNGMLITPLIIASLLALVIIFGAFTGNDVLHFELDAADRAEIMAELQSRTQDDDGEIRNALGLAMHVVAMPLLGVSLLVGFFMLLGSLYDERSERTILFWKSMPVSDTATVLSKLTTGALLIPFSAALIGFVLQIFALIVFTLFGKFNQLPLGASIWSLTPLFQVWANTFAIILLGALWAAPVYGWIMLASSWAPRTPFLIAVVPVITVAVLEGLLNKSLWFITEVLDRLSGSRIFETIAHRISGRDGFNDHDFNLQISGLHVTFNDIGNVLAMPSLWLGLGVAAALIGAAIHIRRTKTL